MIRLSHSSRKILHGCPRQFMLRNRFPKPFVPRQASEVGKAFHKLMELSFRTTPLTDLLSKFERWSKAVQIDHHDEELQENLRFWHLKGLALWRGYLHHAVRLEPKVWQVLDTEYRFQTQISDVYVPGVIDQIVLIANPWFQSDSPRAIKPDCQKVLAIGDFKTTSLPVDVYIQSLLKSEQPTTYLIWSRSNDFPEIYPEVVASFGLPVAVYFDVISTPKIKLKKSESEEEFFERYEQAVTLDREAVTRCLSFPSEQSLNDTILSFALDKQQVEQARATGYWRRGESSCLFFGEMCPWSIECEQCTEGLLDPPSPTQQLFQIEVTHGAEDQDDE